jgi:uncharacterized protein (TIGR04141 family)
MSVETISVYLLKPHVTRAMHALREDAQVTSRHEVRAGDTVGTLFVSDGEEHEPDWVRLLGPVASPPVSRPRRAASAMLVVPAASRWFALTFGSGRHLLDGRAYERDFGLKVALNAVDPDRLRGAQARTFNDYALHTSRQLSRLSDVDALELDVQRDLLKALEGVLRDEEVGRRLVGRDAARLTAELDAAAIASKCAELFVLSESDAYKSAFPWVGTIEEIRDPEEVEVVERLAFDALGKREFSLFDLYPPEFVATEIVEFRHWPGIASAVITEPGPKLLQEPIRIPMSATNARAAVERYRLIGVDSGGDEVDRWTYLECLHFETVHAGATYILDGGSWYRIEQNLVTDVESFMQSLGPSNLQLPDAGRGQIERHYNEMAAERPDLTLIDRKLVYLMGRSSVEPCDLLSPQGHLVHVKPRKGGSAPLSHLFAQAVVSAECLLGEPEFQKQFRALLQKHDPAFVPMLDDPIRARNFSIVLALITDRPGTAYPARELPFFSKLTLRLAVQRLRNMRFKVYVDGIARTQSVSPAAPKPGRKRRTTTPAAVRAKPGARRLS